ncbi:DDE_3 domain-containing protein [Trichonephila clavipes]|nr:DDE_3 domain-containing protein [Trichonephila clavipes]
MPLRRNRWQYEQLTDFDRGRITGPREAGWSNRRIGRHRSERYGSCSVLAIVGSQKVECTVARAVSTGFFADLGQLECDRLRRVIFSDESRFSLSDDDHRTRVGGAPASGPIRHLLSSGIQQFHKVPFINRIMLVHILRDSPNNVFKDMTSYHGLPGHPDLSPIEHVLDALGRQLQPSRDTGELTAQMQRLWQDLPQGVISDLIESMPRRISACIAARGGFTTY